jgi:hypothetical protein
MGSSGTSHFSDYPEKPKKKLPPKGGKTGTSGGGSGSDPCDKAFETELEDVGSSDYYRKHKAVPPKGTSVAIDLRTRLVAVTAKDEVVGNLPTKFNSLAQCIKDGWKYRGVVTYSSVTLFPKVSIDAGPAE